MTALRLGYQAIKTENAEMLLPRCGEHGEYPLIARADKIRWGSKLGPIELEDVLFELVIAARGSSSCQDSGEVAVEYGVTREMQDRWRFKAISVGLKHMRKANTSG